MTEQTFEPLSPAELAEIDAQYGSFPSFSEWPQDIPEKDSWIRARIALQASVDEASEQDLEHARAIARRAAAFDTGAIEGLYSTNRGLTFTVAEQAALWEQKVEAQGADARALFEAQLRAFELVLDHATQSVPKITQAWLRRLHEEITQPQATYVVHTSVGSQEQPLPKGEYKNFPNHVRTAGDGVHAYAPVESTQAEMERLVDELETPAFKDAHVVTQAAYLHYALVAIHPFADGNGRLARAAASVYTYREASIPLMVLDEHRDLYLATLAKADKGDVQPFIGLVSRVTRETIDLVRDNLETAKVPQPEKLLTKFADLYDQEREKLHRNEMVRRFADWLVGVVEKQVTELDLPEGVQVSVKTFPATKKEAPKGFKDLDIGGARSIRLDLDSAPPAAATSHRRFDLFVPRNPDDAESVLIRGVQMSTEQLSLAASDLEPQVSGLSRRKIANYVQRQLSDGLSELLSEVESKLGPR